LIIRGISIQTDKIVFSRILIVLELINKPQDKDKKILSGDLGEVSGILPKRILYYCSPFKKS
jgi:hypothetical protein